MKVYDYKKKKKYPISISKNPVRFRIKLPPLHSSILSNKKKFNILSWFFKIFKRIINWIRRIK